MGAAERRPEARLKIRLRESSMRAQFVDVKGVNTRYLSAGEGNAIVLLHGVGMSGDCFHRNIDALAKSSFVVAPDMLGHGFTAYPGFGGLPPPLAMARHVVALTESIGIERCCVVGSSLGGLVAALMFFERPALVDKLVLAASSSCINTPAQQEAVLKASAANALNAMKDPSLAGLRRRLRNIVFADSGVSEELLLVQLTSYAYPDRAVAYTDTINEFIDAIFVSEGQVSHRLNELTIPVLMVAGRDDIRTPVDRQTEGVRRFPSAELKIYEQCGHFPFLEHPMRFHDDLNAFLQR
jgi:pimeloyl-ACP methyl ester carboxylesterase